MIEKIIDKISSYQFFNFFYPGAIFIAIMGYLMKKDYTDFTIWHLLLSCYFLGMTFSRLGSLLIECPMVKCRFIEKIDYCKQIKAEKKDSKVMLLLEICNTFRTLSATFFVLTFLMLMENCLKIGLNFSNKEVAFCFFIAVLFLFSFKKQYMYVKNRVELITSIDI